MKCPVCGSPMVKRQNRESQETFWGCTNYPSCTGTRPISEYEKMLEAGAPTLFDVKELT